MVKDAQAHESEDKSKREKIDTINTADSLAYQTEKNLREWGDKLDTDQKNKVQAAVDRLKDAAKREDLNEIKSATDALNNLMHEVAAKLYSQTPPPGGQPGNGGNGNTNTGQQPDSSAGQNKKPGGDAVDADFEVVN